MIKEIFPKQKGVSLYYAVVITSILLAIALGLGTILISQIRGLKEMGDSVIAFFAADTGMEKILYLDAICQKQENCTSTSPFYTLCSGQAGLAGTTTCIGLYNYPTSTDLTSDLRFEARATTTVIGGATTTIFHSKGIYKKIQRAIQASR